MNKLHNLPPPLQSKYLEDLMPTVKVICQKIQFMGIKLANNLTWNDQLIHFTEPDSTVAIVGSKSTRREIMCDTMRQFAKDEDGLRPYT